MDSYSHRETVKSNDLDRRGKRSQRSSRPLKKLQSGDASKLRSFDNHSNGDIRGDMNVRIKWGYEQWRSWEMGLLSMGYLKKAEVFPWNMTNMVWLIFGDGWISLSHIERDQQVGCGYWAPGPLGRAQGKAFDHLVHRRLGDEGVTKKCSGVYKPT